MPFLITLWRFAENIQTPASDATIDSLAAQVSNKLLNRATHQSVTAYARPTPFVPRIEYLLGQEVKAFFYADLGILAGRRARRMLDHRGDRKF